MESRRTIERSALGAWLLKCNPTLWDLRGFIDAGATRLTSWAVQPGYRARLMAPGDRVLLWVSGDGSAGLGRGIWGLGHTTAEAEPWVETAQGRWRSAASRHVVRARVELDVALLDAPVTDRQLRAAGVEGLEVQRQPFMANPSYVSRDQLAVVETLLPPWPPSPSSEEARA